MVRMGYCRQYDRVPIINSKIYVVCSAVGENQICDKNSASQMQNAIKDQIKISVKQLGPNMHVTKLAGLHNQRY